MLQPIETLHDDQKWAKSGVLYIFILNITGDIYFIAQKNDL